MLYDLWNVEYKAEEDMLRELAKHMVANGFDIKEELRIIMENDMVYPKDATKAHRAFLKQQDYERPF